MRRDAPLRLLVGTAACIVLVNVVLAQVIVQALYPASGLRLGAFVLGALGLVAVVSAIYTVRGWRAYLRRPDD